MGVLVVIGFGALLGLDALLGVWVMFPLALPALGSGLAFTACCQVGAGIGFIRTLLPPPPPLLPPLEGVGVDGLLRFTGVIPERLIFTKPIPGM